MLDRKNLTYLAERGVLFVKDRTITIIEDRLNIHDVYRINLNNSIIIAFIHDRAMTTSTSKFFADIVT